MDPIEKARQIYKEYNPHELIPFPFQEIINRNNDVSISYTNMQDVPDVSGAILYNEAKKCFDVLVDSSDNIRRQYFTLGHEIGHYFMHKNKIKKDNNKKGLVEDDRNLSLGFDAILLRDGSHGKTEYEANCFAAELLMPEDKLREIWAITGGNVSKCADIFNVSLSAMSVRVGSLGLPDE